MWQAKIVSPLTTVPRGRSRPPASLGQKPRLGGALLETIGGDLPMKSDSRVAQRQGCAPWPPSSYCVLAHHSCQRISISGTYEARVWCPEHRA